MGLTVLYIAFGIVALWLLGEVLLQYKARLRWRLLAFGGFLTVVLGVLMASRAVIGLGVLVFAVGQTYVTLSFRKGFSTGWAIGGRPGASRRRKAGSAQESAVASLEVSGLEESTSEQAAAAHPFTPAGPETGEGAVYEPEPMPDDTGQYGVYSDTGFAAAQQGPGPEQEPGGPGCGAFDPYYVPGPGAEDTGEQYDYGPGQGQYAAYSDPYVGGQQYSAYESYDSFGNPQPYTPDPYYAPQPYPETPPGGVWVPQQRDPEPGGPQEPAPYDYEPGPNEQQEFRY
ncbi:hypothetical protein ACFYT4_24550 [Streptomyces sp. NPDC004609]|uniref:hypothetical protein n=1 Tax=Streptomyces sp. NPDC004609 TaxID=3364704 RepID=UPI0036952E54